MTKETAKAIKQLIPNQDKALMMASSINNAISLLKLYKLSNQEIKTIITAMVIGQEDIVSNAPMDEEEYVAYLVNNWLTNQEEEFYKLGYYDIGDFDLIIENQG